MHVTQAGIAKQVGTIPREFAGTFRTTAIIGASVIAFAALAAYVIARYPNVFPAPVRALSNAAGNAGSWFGA